MKFGSVARRLWWAPLLLAPFLWLGSLVAGPRGFPFLRGAPYSDLVISHWPSAWFLHTALVTWHQLPLWNPSILSGMPLAADPLTGFWYLPQWLAILLPSALGFNLVFFSHLVWAGMGMALFVRRLGLGRAAAVFCGLAYGGLPKLVGHVGMGHVGLVSAVSWTPWWLLTLDRASTATDGRTARRWFAVAGLTFAGSFLADPRWALPMLLLGGAWLIRVWIAPRSGVPSAGRNRIAGVIVGGGVATLVSAVLLIPLAELLRLSTRMDLTDADASFQSLPPVRLLSLMDSHAAGTPEWQAYVGLLVIFLAGSALVLRTPARWFWLGAVAASLLWSLGDHVPLYRLLAWILPGAFVLRVPARFLYLTAFGWIVLAGWGLNTLLAGSLKFRQVQAIRLWGFGLMVLGLLYFVALQVGLGADPTRWAGVAVAIAVGALAAEAGRGSRRAGWLTAAAIVVLVADFASIDLLQLESRPQEAVLGQQAVVTEKVRSLSGETGARAFSPSYSIPQQTAAASGLELADGVHPIQLRAYRDFMATAAGFSPEGYSVTLPPFPSGNPADDWDPAIQLDQLGMLGVGTIASAYELEGLVAAGTAEGTFLYINPEARPRAWIEPEGSSQTWDPVDDWRWTPNRIEVAARGPGRLVISEIDYPGWKASVDGSPVEVAVAHAVLRAVPLTAGVHQVVFAYRPLSVILGTALGIAGLVLFVLGWRPW